jgi:hypothetical protein
LSISINFNCLLSSILSDLVRAWSCSSVFITVALLFLQGCVAVQTFPTAARSGDTITLAVGSPEGMTKDNTTAQFVHNNTSIDPIDLTVRSVIRLRPDNTSDVALFNINIRSISGYTKHSAWLSVLVLDLPPNMPTGDGVINISTPASYFGLNIADKPVAIKILPGEGSSNPFNYDMGSGFDTQGDLTSLEPLQQVLVKPPATYSAANYGAAEIKINVPMRKVSDASVIVPDKDIRVVMDDKYSLNTMNQVHMSWSRTGDVITVNFISPIGTMSNSQTRFSVVLDSPDVTNQYLRTPGPRVISVRFFDPNGNVVTSSTPTADDYEITIE